MKPITINNKVNYKKIKNYPKYAICFGLNYVTLHTYIYIYIPVNKLFVGKQFYLHIHVFNPLHNNMY